MFAFVVILILCSPLILGPLLIPAIKQGKTDEALERLLGKDERLPSGLAVEPATRASYGKYPYCDVQVDANLTKVDCGGRLHDVTETLEGSAPVRLCTVCFVCGRLEKTGSASTVLGTYFEQVVDAKGLERAVSWARRRDWHAQRAA